MKISKRLLFAGALSMIASCYGCSGDKDEAEEPVAEGEEKDGEEAAAPAEEAAPAEPEPAPAPEVAPAPEPAPAPAATGPVGFDGAKVTKYVTTYALNVRTAPDKNAPVKRWVKKGDKVDVVINGEWAKLGENEYVSSNRLSDKNPGPSKSGGGGKAKAKPKKGKK